MLEKRRGNTQGRDGVLTRLKSSLPYAHEDGKRSQVLMEMSAEQVRMEMDTGLRTELPIRRDMEERGVINPGSRAELPTPRNTRKGGNMVVA